MIEIIAEIVMTLIITAFVIVGTVLMQFGVETLWIETRGYRIEYPSVAFGIVIIITGIGIEFGAYALLLMAMVP